MNKFKYYREQSLLWRYYNSMLKKFLIILFILFSLGMFFVLKNNEVNTYDIFFTKFIRNIKSENYIKAFSELYPLIRQNNKEAFLLIAEVYQSNSYGIEMDLIKSRIWNERYRIGSYDTGILEYNQYHYFMKKGDLGMASVFLQKSAEKGNKNAIYILKNKEFINKNNLYLDIKWSKYWEQFDYDELYPFCRKIKECSDDILNDK